MLYINYVINYIKLYIN